MKIEMGESLFYSWLRHVKECQIVQTNWKTSSQWNLQNEDELEYILRKTDDFFWRNANYRIYKNNSSLSQILQQSECDAIGISLQNDGIKVYAVDVAFHEYGLNYGSRDETIMKIILKSIRTAMCIYGYLNIKEGEVVFASPKINPSIIGGATGYVKDIQDLFEDMGFNYVFRIIANEEFKEKVLDPILLVSDGVADTNELFVRSYQMLQMFDNGNTANASTRSRKDKDIITGAEAVDVYKELKVGQLARTMIPKAILSGNVTDEEIRLLQTSEYSKQHFDVQYPVLVAADGEYERVRYYKKPIVYKGKQYMLTSQWFEVSTNNDRPHLIVWLKEHGM